MYPIEKNSKKGETSCLPHVSLHCLEEVGSLQHGNRVFRTLTEGGERAYLIEGWSFFFLSLSLSSSFSSSFFPFLSLFSFFSLVSCSSSLKNVGGGFIREGMREVKRVEECRRSEVFGGGKEMEMCGGEGG